MEVCEVDKEIGRCGEQKIRITYSTCNGIEAKKKKINI